MVQHSNFSLHDLLITEISKPIQDANSTRVSPHLCMLSSRPVKVPVYMGDCLDDFDYGLCFPSTFTLQAFLSYKLEICQKQEGADS